MYRPMKFTRFLRCLCHIGIAVCCVVDSALGQSVEIGLNQTCQVPIYADGDGIVLQVKHREKSYQFLLDTGCAYTFLDTATFRPILKPFHADKSNSKDPLSVSDKFTNPGDFTICGQLPIRENPLYCTDLSLLSAVRGQKLDGILGCDFLNGIVLEVDSDSGVLRMSPAVLKHSGKCFELSRDDLSRPIYKANLREFAPKSVNAEFIIDTGRVGFGGITLRKELFQSYVDLGLLKVEGTQQVVQAGGRSVERFGTLSEFAVWNEFRNIQVKEKAGLQKNLLGLSYLFQFNFTIDFPNSKLYLRPRKTKQDLLRLRDLSGLSVIRDELNVVVQKVYPSSPGAIAGIGDGDIIATVDGVPTQTMRLFVLRKSFSVDGNRMKLGMRRGTKKWTVDLELRDWRNSASEKDFE